MPSPAAPRVFISYSSKDTDIVDRLKAALAAAGVAVWLDHEQLTPGTPNWQLAVREGIGQASAVVYVASENAAISPYVIDEISLARGKGKSVIPFWARGEAWHDCAPLGWGLTQYTDGRNAAYAGGLAKLLDALGAAPRTATPTVSATQSRPPQPQPHSHGGRAVLPGHHAAAAPAAIPPVAKPAPQPARYPPPGLPQRLVNLGFRSVNPRGTSVILPPLVSVAAGPFLMGSDIRRDPQAYDDETPPHRVEVAAFQIGKYPVTVVEYALAMRAGAVPEPPESLSVNWQTQLQRLDHPVVCVSWQDAQAYLKWLRETTGEPGWRLPTEAEWEKAARWDALRNASRLYPWGDRFDKARCTTSESGVGHSTAVGAYPANDVRRSGASPWGAEEMVGNVWEWTSSLYKPYPYTLNDDREASHSAGNRTLRGGSWFSSARLGRAAVRSYVGPSNRHDGFGFRLALSASAGG